MTPFLSAGVKMTGHPFTACGLFSDPGGEWEAPFAGEARTQALAFLPLCAQLPPWSLACPPPALQSGFGAGCAPGAPGACWGPSPSMKDFFGVPPGAPAIWVDGGAPKNPQFTATR